jgi:cyclopropane fatty-acyl-phospholipid synthase-like methyltransferase
MSAMRLKKKLPEDRTLEQIKNHYEVEKAIARRVKNSTREERAALYPHIYEEIFEKVPDHPRLKARENAAENDARREAKLRLVKKYLKKSGAYAEFGPGDCRFASAVTPFVEHVYALDISDQRSQAFKTAENFSLILYDGYRLDLKDGSIDVVFSDQLIEHLLPEDVEFHFALARRILGDDGVYVLSTPHAFFGPHDISGYFSDVPEGLHFKEWTYSEIAGILKRLGYSFRHGFMKRGKGYRRIPLGYFLLMETLLRHLPVKPRGRRALSRFFLPRHLVMIAGK